MDLKYIQNEHIVDRYLAGELTVREARQFEQFCHAHPEFLGKLSIPAHLKSRLARKPGDSGDTGPSGTSRAAMDAGEEGFDADEEDEKWQRSSGSGKTNRVVVIGLAAALLAAIGGLVAYALQAGSLNDKLRQTQRQMKSLAMQAPAGLQTHRLQLVGTKPAAPALVLGWLQPAQLLELVVATTEESFTTYQITIDKDDGTRAMQIHRIARDSNKEVRFSLNSSAFGPGNYVIKVEGYTWRGELQLVGWAGLGLE